MRRTSLVTALVITSGLALAACGSDADNAASVSTDMGVTVAGAAGEKPDLTIPEDDPSAELETEVLSEGDGAEVGADDFVVAHYLGQTWAPKDGEENVFDNSYDRGQVSGFSLNGVVPGWKEGLTGQTVGSRVLLSIPPDLGYGGDPTSELAEDTLVFVVDIVDVVPADAGVSGTPVADLPADLPVVAGEGAADPTVTFPATATPPTTSGATLLVAGDGDDLGTLTAPAPEATDGTEAPADPAAAATNIVVQVLQASYATGEVQYSSRSEIGGQPAQGALAMPADQLPGLAEALEGQKVGSRVLVRIAAADNVTEAAPAGEALALVIDVVGKFDPQEEQK